MIDGAWKMAAVYLIDSPRGLRLLTLLAFMLGHRFHEILCTRGLRARSAPAGLIVWKKADPLPGWRTERNGGLKNVWLHMRNSRASGGRRSCAVSMGSAGVAGRAGSESRAGLSAVVLMDELGRPMANVAVQVTINGATNPQNTDNHGMIVFAATPAGTAVVLRLVDTHMAQAGESTNDASGRHFRLLGDGP